MDLVGEFHKVEIDGKPFLLYHNILKPSPQIHNPNSSTQIAIDSCDDLPFEPLFLCPRRRARLLLNLPRNREIKEVFLKYNTSPLLDDTTSGHHALPLFWCNNKEADPEGECYTCKIPKVGTNYYFCVECDKRFHKECVELPLEISYPSHPKHSLKLYYSQYRSDLCIYCRERATYLVYYCALCDVYMHVLCAQETIPFFIDQPKRHDHTLTLFPRLASLACNICALVKCHLTYACSICNFLVHKDCLDIPQTIRICRHHHRVSFTFSLPFENWSCGVCRRVVDSDYGAYSCKVCSGYVVHTKCALRKDIWDGIELEGVPEEDEGLELEPFKRIADGVILHFTHDHQLILELNGVYDGNKYCQACALPIYNENFYVCVECDFILHETCVEAPRKKFHPLHSHPLQLETIHDEDGFSVYMRCAFISEPFNYQGHQHPLFLALDPEEKPLCHICKSTDDDIKVLNCIECDFIICFLCATLPYMARYKHDKHYLTFCDGDEASDSDWCELCEGNLAIGVKRGFYKCNDCCTTLHIDCLFGDSPYMKPGQQIKVGRDGKYEIHILRNNSVSRPICMECDIYCPYPIFYIYNGRGALCSITCIRDYAAIR
ncbi:hypothetical protein AALP_AA5G015600 [Arabis alpina]|uniref:Zinc finger PHD-type domain-containing protein n=1 Tax=Arabis alpina TaxID=50452 RepID=A0A087GU98_ARAAL|nr:hypothetical protein AALP_AA5G015600 [Arabis alpina]